MSIVHADYKGKAMKQKQVGRYYRWINPQCEHWNPVVRIVQTTLVTEESGGKLDHSEHVVHKCEIVEIIPDDYRQTLQSDDNCEVHVHACDFELFEGCGG